MIIALTEREKKILELSGKSVLSDYKIARRLHTYQVNVSRSKQRALNKIENAKADLAFYEKINKKAKSNVESGQTTD